MSNPDVNTMKKTMSEESRSPAGDRETRQQILEAARELFLARGYKGVSMKEEEFPCRFENLLPGFEIGRAHV